MRAVIIKVLLLLAFGTQGQAGAWLRNNGETFVSTSATYNRVGDIAVNSYAEFGYSDRFTLGLDTHTAMKNSGKRSGFGAVFIRSPIGKVDKMSKWAWETGLGLAWADQLALPFARVGLSFGRPITWRDKGGWVAVDGTIDHRFRPSRTTLKLDTTLGLQMSKRVSAMMQLFAYSADGRTMATVAPSLLVKSPSSKYTFQIGTKFPADRTAHSSVKLGLWTEF